MIEFYPQIKAIHIAAVIASGVLFFLRGAAVHTGRSWAMAGPVRYASYLIDTTLLTAAVMLATILHQYPFVHGWLTAKVLLLVVYIGLGTFALKRGATRKIRVWCWIAALIVYGFIISIARAHHPLGVFAEASSQACAAHEPVVPWCRLVHRDAARWKSPSTSTTPCRSSSS